MWKKQVWSKNVLRGCCKLASTGNTSTAKCCLRKYTFQKYISLKYIFLKCIFMKCIFSKAYLSKVYFKVCQALFDSRSSHKSQQSKPPFFLPKHSKFQIVIYSKSNCLCRASLGLVSTYCQFFYMDSEILCWYEYIQNFGN